MNRFPERPVDPPEPPPSLLERLAEEVDSSGEPEDIAMRIWLDRVDADGLEELLARALDWAYERGAADNVEFSQGPDDEIDWKVDV